ncbi:ABC transporter permease [Methylocaldum sp.]|uniref:ABC transporter permease n=1 Tax=Methylocaldum sp. TaxID=1969727 RepID=UPI002D3B370D|nr:ABC transporter permease [Methylocaldum sp.]HYE36528.1 ABC transporter permease [Methylocaldum sp.]
MLIFVLRNLFRQTVRSVLTLTVIALGVAGISLVGGFIEDIFVQLRESTIHSQLGHLQVYRSGFSTIGRRDPYKFLMEDTGGLVDQFRTWPEVAEVMKRVSFSGLANNGRSDYPILGEGVEPAKEKQVGSMLSIVEGEQLNDTDSMAILVGKGLAHSLKIKPGDPLTLLVNTPGGALNSLEFTVIGIFQSFSKDFDDRAVRISLGAAQDLLATPGIHALVFALNDTADTDRVAKKLMAQLPFDQYEVKPWYVLADFYQKTVDMYRRQFAVLEIIILVMVLLSVANSVNMALHERTGEFGTLMALGNKPRDVFKLIILEYSILGLVGAVVGAFLGVSLAWGISAFGISMPPPPNSDMGYTAIVRVVPHVIGVAFVVGFLAAALAAIIPARRVIRIPIVEALRSNI